MPNELPVKQVTITLHGKPAAGKSMLACMLADFLSKLDVPCFVSVDDEGNHVDNADQQAWRHYLTSPYYMREPMSIRIVVPDTHT
jgi:adenylylsulfate kinase-like enzyme